MKRSSKKIPCFTGGGYIVESVMDMGEMGRHEWSLTKKG